MSKICLPFNSYKQNISQLNAKYGKNMKNEQLRLALCFFVTSRNLSPFSINHNKHKKLLF